MAQDGGGLEQRLHVDSCGLAKLTASALFGSRPARRRLRWPDWQSHSRGHSDRNLCAEARRLATTWGITPTWWPSVRPGHVWISGSPEFRQRATSSKRIARKHASHRAEADCPYFLMATEVNDRSTASLWSPVSPTRPKAGAIDDIFCSHSHVVITC